MARMGGDEWLQYVIERALASWADARSRQARPAAKEPWSRKWFGLVPMGFRLWWRKRKRQKPHAPDS